jgi:ribosomal protein S18 acetylase RimI-like enzyme
MSSTPRIEEVRATSSEILEAIQGLVEQLSSSATPPTESRLVEIISSPSCRLLVGRDDSRHIVAMLTLVLFPIPTGLRAWIEDVVVRPSARGQGLGGLLVRDAIRLAQEAGARTIDLTSRPDREAANALYVREGFELRESNVYRLRI